MRRVVEDIGLPVVQVGIRSFSKAEADFVQKRDLSPFYTHHIDFTGDAWADRVVDNLPNNVYITLDLDSLDPSEMPGTGTPEPGGLSYRQILLLLKKVGGSKRVVAADINELVKIEGTRVSEFTAARIASKIIVYCCANK
jgi:agmatinase